MIGLPQPFSTDIMALQTRDLVVPVLAAGAVAAVVRVWHPGRSKTARGRLRDLGWYAALLALSVCVVSTVSGGLGGSSPEWWGLLTLAAAAIAIAFRPGWVRRIVPLALVFYGLLGFVVLRDYAIGGGGTTYGLYTTGDWNVEVELILAQAYLFLLAGLWLVWRGADQATEQRRRLLGRLTDVHPRAQVAALLLPPTVIAAVAFATPELGWGTSFILTPLLLAGAVLLLRGRPAIAARVAAVGLVAIGLVGVAFIAGASPGTFDYARIEPVPWSFILGPIVVASPQAKAAAAIESIGLLAFGAWLIPQTFPLVRRLLRMAPEPELLRRVAHLTVSRAAAVDTASADLRRLERDLHDGAQARLVALGMSLRAAERLIPTSPEAAIALVAEARASSARALTELRELVRGVLPPVLADRGLADAVRALALDCPLNVETDIDLPGRPPAPIETACYFAVAEILTNAAKHSGGRAARIVMMHAGGVLRIEVTDFGLGGADPSAGSGLAGVERRLATFDGILVVSSPIGGPTIIVMEVPCALSSPKTSSS
jgi:signal transduction histidine kinase